MEHRERICAYYSHGPHFRRVLKQLRDTHPEAKLTAMVPPRYPTDAVAELADQIAVTAKDQYRATDLSGNWALVKQIRSGGYDRFVVMFESPKLGLLSLLAGAKSRNACTIDGRYGPMRLSLLSLLADTIHRRIRGWTTYLYIRHIVHHRPVQRDNEK